MDITGIGASDGTMPTRTSRWPNGVPCWAELAVPDVTAAKRFYSDVLGWTYRPTDIEFGGYVIAEVDGATVAGLGPLPPGAPAAWRLYLAGDDADRIAAAVPEHGGQLLVKPRDVGRLGRMFVAADPGGAKFGVWQSGNHIGAERVNEAGCLIWEDLFAPDPPAARTFYSAVFGYDTQPLPEGGVDFHVFGLPTADGEALGGIGGFTAGDRTAHWELYFAVADTDETVAVAEKAGAAIRGREPDAPYGSTAGLTDPFGAGFHILQAP
jgi:predicted enzyme related to lactoylglutathione lyase